MADVDDIGVVSGKVVGSSVVENVGNGGAGSFVGASVILPTMGDGTTVGLCTAVRDAVGCGVVDSIGAIVGTDIGDNDGTSIGA